MSERDGRRERGREGTGDMYFTAQPVVPMGPKD